MHQAPDIADESRLSAPARDGSAAGEKKHHLRVVLLSVAAGLCLFGSLIVPFYAQILAFAANSGERRGVIQHDRPDAYSLLQFGEWQEGAGTRQTSSLANVPEGAAIVRHRAGRASGWLTRFEYHEAEYRLPDGSLRITHAGSPRMVFLRSGVVGVSFLAPLGLAVLLLWWAWRLDGQLNHQVRERQDTSGGG